MVPQKIQSFYFFQLIEKHGLLLNITDHVTRRMNKRVRGCGAPHIPEMMIYNYVQESIAFFMHEINGEQFYKLHYFDWRFIVRVNLTRRVVTIITCYKKFDKPFRRKYRHSRAKQRRSWRACAC